jgi:hypothetical protein
MELSIGSNDPVDSITLHIRGSGDDVLISIVRLANALGCKALDISTGSLISTRDASGWHGFQEYRDRVIGAAERLPADRSPTPEVADAPDTSAGRHAQRMFESVHALTDTGLSSTPQPGNCGSTGAP